MAYKPVTKVSLNITDAVIIHAAAVKFLKIYETSRAYKAPIQKTEPVGLVEALERVTATLKENIGAE